MLKKNEVDLQQSLNNALGEWWEEATSNDIGGTDIPYIGDDVIEIMSVSALQVLLGIINTQEFLQEQGMLKE